MNRDNCFDTDMEFVTTGTSVKCVKHFWVLVKCLRFFSSKIDIFLESYWCKRFDEFQVCCDISSCQGNGVSNREKLNFEKVFLSLFLPGAEGGRRWAISAIPMKNTENTNNNKKQKNTQNTKNRWQGKVLCRCEHVGSPIRRNNWRGEQKLLWMDIS